MTLTETFDTRKKPVLKAAIFLENRGVGKTMRIRIINELE